MKEGGAVGWQVRGEWKGKVRAEGREWVSWGRMSVR
jgi:hypothetical protein